MGQEGPRQSNEGNNIDRERAKLEANLSELSGNLDELESSEPSRKEKVMAFVQEKYPILVGTLAGLSAGAGDWLVRGGTVEDFLFKTGLGILMGAAIQYGIDKVKAKSEERKKRMGLDETNES